jgi:hypothetical protein
LNPAATADVLVLCVGWGRKRAGHIPHRRLARALPELHWSAPIGHADSATLLLTARLVSCQQSGWSGGSKKRQRCTVSSGRAAGSGGSSPSARSARSGSKRGEKKSSEGSEAGIGVLRALGPAGGASWRSDMLLGVWRRLLECFVSAVGDAQRDVTMIRASAARNKRVSFRVLRLLCALCHLAGLWRL